MFRKLVCRKRSQNNEFAIVPIEQHNAGPIVIFTRNKVARNEDCLPDVSSKISLLFYYW